MYCSVLLLNGFDKELWYSVPPALQDVIRVGVLVRVPLQNRQESALVKGVFKQLPAGTTFKVKDIFAREPLPDDEHYHEFIEKIAHFYVQPALHFYARVTTFLHNAQQEESDDAGNAQVQDAAHVQLTQEQQIIVDYVTPRILTPAYEPVLIHGVTGSGKTEVYKRLIQEAIGAQRSVLFLLPEVSLSLQFERLLKHQLPTITFFGFHSATAPAERRALWAALRAGRPVVIVGVHLPVMLPIKHLGLIIIDEEHEQGFIEKKHPKVNSKEVALWRALMYRIPIVLGSATPSMNSLYNVQQGRWKLFQMTTRFSGAFPEVRKVLLGSSEGKRRKHFWISPELKEAVQACLERKEQAMMYLNRRGYSFFVQCKQCGFVFECPACSVSLTLHMTHGKQLRCHYCDYYRDLPDACPTCGASERQFLKKGLGTQQAVQIFKEAFPDARIERADLDTTSKKRAWKLTVEAFEKGDIDILIGTQTITKGYHFPGVTLVGVLWADLNLQFPVFNAAETTLQQIIQVAGRAGRCREKSLVIVQTIKDHSIFDYIHESAYRTFCDQELEHRSAAWYPPVCRLAYIEVRHKDAYCVDRDAQACIDYLTALAMREKRDVIVLGPAQPMIARIQHVEIRHIFLKAASFKDIHFILSAALQQHYQSDLYVVMHE